MNENQIIQMCLDDPEVERILRKFVEVHYKKEGEEWWLGLEWNDVPAPPRKLNSLVEKGILVMPFKSRSSKHYKLADLQSVENVMRRLENKENDFVLDSPGKIPSNIFEDIVGHDDVKYWLRRLLQTDGPAGALLIGPPASAKTLLLEEIAEKLGGQYYTGTGATRKGIQRYISDMEPKILIIDELDKLGDYDQSALLSVLESGTVAELKVGRTFRKQLDIKVFAAGNYVRNVSPLLISRFRPYVFYFSPYTKQEYIEIVSIIGPKRYDHSKEFCIRVAESMWTIATGDPRAAMNALKVCKDESDLEKLVATVRKYSR